MNKKLALIYSAIGIIVLSLSSLAAYLYTKNRNVISSGGTSSIISTVTPVITHTPTPEIRFASYKDKDGKFEFQYPKGWTENFEYKQLLVMLLSPKESETDPYQENINIAREELTDDKYTVDQYNEYAKYNLNETFLDFKIVSNEKIKIGDTDAFKLTFTGVTKDQNNRKIKVQQRYVIKDKIVYVLTYTGNEDAYEKYESDAMHSLDSFKII